MVSKQKIIKILDILEKTHGETMLEEFSHFTPFQVVIATLLSARTKDATVIPIVVDLFSKYPTVYDLNKLTIVQLEKWFYRIGFFRAKAKNVKKLCKIIIEDFDGLVPDTLEELLTLPGVGRKTANCVLAYAFKKPAIAVDIHVHRIVNKGRLHWMDTKNPDETEQELMRLVPKKRWRDVNKLLVDHGQRICAPIRPKCWDCGITKFCEYKDKKL